MDLEGALGQFDRVETNLRRLEKVSGELDALVPGGIVFAGASPEGLQYSDLCRDFMALAGALSAIDGYCIDVHLMSLDDIAQNRLDAADIGEPQVLIELARNMGAPAEAIAEYRHRSIERAGEWYASVPRHS